MSLSNNDNNNSVLTQQSDVDPTALVDTLLLDTERLMQEPLSCSNNALQPMHVVAYSGGVDSSLVTALLAQVVGSCPDNNNKIQAVLGRSPAVSREQVEQARHVVKHLPAAHMVEYHEVETHEGSHPTYIKNAGQACWACKTHLYSTLQAVHQHTSRTAADSSITNVKLYNGTNADDATDPTRVGLVAAQEWNVQSPLLHIPKAHVRIAAQALGLPNWNAAAAPCLRSRLALGVPATKEHLHKMERAERRVRECLMKLQTHDNHKDDLTMMMMQSINMRVRLLARQRARIEIDAPLVPYAEHVILPSVTPYFLNELGFSSVSVRAFASGSVAGNATSRTTMMEAGDSSTATTTETTIPNLHGYDPNDSCGEEEASISV